MKAQIEFADFMEIEKKLEIKWGRVYHVERVPKSKKLLKLTVLFGEEDSRTVVTNIGEHLEDEQTLLWQRFPFVTNLKPVTMMGIESTAMIMPSTTPTGELYLWKEPVLGQTFPPDGSTLL